MMTFPTPDLLRAHHVLESVDVVARDPATSAFKRRARLHQALWRERMELPIGSQPMVAKPGEDSRPLGSRLDLEFARRSGANFLDDRIRHAVADRLSRPEKHQTLNEHRLFGDLLSSMPMCFNLFGPLHADLELADRAVHAWWPRVPGKVRAVRFEWSPGRAIPGMYLENRSAFDVAFELDLPDGARGLLGVETKYHEDCKAESTPSPGRLDRYRLVSERSGIFRDGAVDRIIGTDLQQIWLDHLLALSLVQEPDPLWSWSAFVLIHPAGNPSFARSTSRYRELLADPTSFHVSTLEELLGAGTLEPDHAAAFHNRYMWDSRSVPPGEDV
jgi:hypothetical protein